MLAIILTLTVLSTLADNTACNGSLKKKKKPGPQEWGKQHDQHLEGSVIVWGKTTHTTLVLGSVVTVARYRHLDNQ